MNRLGAQPRLADAVPGQVARSGRRSWRQRFSPLARRIIFFNAVALIVMIAGVVAVQSNSVGLVDERLEGVKAQALIVASTLSEYTTDEDTREIDIAEAQPLLRQLIQPTRLRARLYGTDGMLAIDTRNLLPRNVVETHELPSIDMRHQMLGWWDRIYDSVMGIRSFGGLPRYREAGSDGRAYGEVVAALSGTIATAERSDAQHKLVLSVAVPIQRFKAIYGVLLVSTEGGDIDAVQGEERATLFEVFLVAFIVMVLSSLYLAGFVVQPVRRLAAAADRVRHGRSGRETIPQMSERRDEISDLASSLSAMMRALYDRMDAIERFAADVAHELKNPLTSLKSAVEMLGRTEDDSSRRKMMEIVRSDVRRIDRLISDISDASRLDAELSRGHSAPVSIASLLQAIVEIHSLSNDRENIGLTLDLNLPPDARVLGQDERLGQVFRNLIDNAISFSAENGTVAIRADSVANKARIAVEDDGPGIPPDNLDTIFQRFYTQRPAGHGFGNNSGLGLSIARQIVEGNGGRVWAENRRDAEGAIAGARFVVELPLVKPSK